jgi:hypothetical protein
VYYYTNTNETSPIDGGDNGTRIYFLFYHCCIYLLRMSTNQNRLPVAKLIKCLSLPTFCEDVEVTRERSVTFEGDIGAGEHASSFPWPAYSTSHYNSPYNRVFLHSCQLLHDAAYIEWTGCNMHGKMRNSYKILGEIPPEKSIQRRYGKW